MPDLTSVYETGRNQWRSDIARGDEQFDQALSPLRQAVNMFQVGGGYGKGQRGMVEEQSKQTLAGMNLSNVRSGMSSGSMASGNKARVGKDRTTAFANIEDQRVGFLNQMLSMLSQMMGTRAQTTSSRTNPFLNSYMGNMAATGQATPRTFSIGAGGSWNAIEDHLRKTEQMNARYPR